MPVDSRIKQSKTTLRNLVKDTVKDLIRDEFGLVMIASPDQEDEVYDDLLNLYTLPME